jgi:hypothetical protein
MSDCTDCDSELDAWRGVARGAGAQYLGLVCNFVTLL